MHIAHQTPVACSSCGGQYPDLQHVDFDAAWDGPVLSDDRGNHYPVDDLIVCEQCVRAAVALLPGQDTRDGEIVDLKDRLNRAIDYGVRLQDAMSKLQSALDVRPPETVRSTRRQAQRKAA